MEKACPAARLVTQGSGAVSVPEGLASWNLLRPSLDRQTPARVLLSPQDSALLPLSILDTSSVPVLVSPSAPFRWALGQGLVSPFGPRVKLRKAGVARAAMVAERKERKSGRFCYG